MIAPDLAEPQPTLFSRADRVLSAIGLRSALSRDVVFAILVAVLSGTATAIAVDYVSATESRDPTPEQTVALVGLVSVQSLALAMRRAAPILCLAIVVAFQVLGLAILPTDLAVQGLAPLVAAYTVGAYVERRKALIASAIVLFAEAALGAIANQYVSPIVQEPLFGVPGEPPTDTLWQVFFYVALVAAPTYIGAALVGRMVATRREYLALVTLRAREAIDEERERADAATLAERTRMARELHDIAAHHLSGIAVQAAAVERLVDSDPEAAKESIRWIRAQSKETLSNLRVAVGMLRDADSIDVDGGAPVPGLAVLDALIASERALGRSVSFEVTGDATPLSPIADIAFYRVAQESLANAREHAPDAPVSVSLSHGDGVELVVRNALGAATPPGRHRGLGLVGMRERASLIGASLSAAPVGDEWVVRLTLRETS